jgi:methylmalonyl-CoA mutase cobalamin-binding subunit
MSTPPYFGSALTREAIVDALSALSEELGKKGVIGELCLFGGTVMVLAFNARLSTKDVDAIFHPTTLTRELVRRIGEERQLPPD